MITNFDLSKIKEDKQRLQKAVRERLTGYIIAAFGLVAALAWNDAIKSTIDYFFPMDGSGLWPKFIYALILTVIVAIFTYYISKIFSDNEDKGEIK